MLQRLIIAVLVTAAPATASAVRVRELMGPDFNGDHCPDLPIGSPHESIGNLGTAGAVSILYGTCDGVEYDPTMLSVLHQGVLGIEGGAATNDFFGGTLAWGDFDGDCLHDLAVGVQNTPVGVASNAGVVQIFYGDYEEGFSTATDVILTRDTAGMDDEPGTGDFWGAALAAGDFNADGFDDLAIGAPNDDVGAVTDGGSVQIVYGGTGGLATNAGPGDIVFTQDSAGMSDAVGASDLFGATLAAGDFNCDQYVDLAIGVPGDDVGATNAGAVHVLYGSSSGLSATAGASGDEHWDQTELTSDDGPEQDDTLANGNVTLAVGNFDGNVGIVGNRTIECEDLVIGVSNEDIGAAANAGAIYVIYGTPASGLQSVDPSDDMWYQDVGSIEGASSSGDEFGWSVVAGRFDNDDYDDIAIGVRESNDAGRVAIVLGGSAGLTQVDDVLWDRNHASIPGSMADNEAFGFAVGAGDYDGNGIDDLVTSAPFATVANVSFAGTVFVALLSDSTIPSIASCESWTDNEVGGAIEFNDRFGDVLVPQARNQICVVTP